MRKEVDEKRNEIFNNKILKDVVEYDKFNNKKIVQKLVDRIG